LEKTAQELIARFGLGAKDKQPILAAALGVINLPAVAKPVVNRSKPLNLAVTI
jgi:hypothetical protein